MTYDYTKTFRYAWDETTLGMDRWDAIHLILSVLLLALAGGSRLPNLNWLGLPAVIGIDLYLFGLLLVAACRCYWMLPERLTALFIVPCTFLALVLAFGTLFLKCDCFEKRSEFSIEPAVVTVSEKRGDLRIEPKTAVITVSPPKMLPDGTQATYVSLAVITTAAPDYAPTNRQGDREVAEETVSGLLFLLVAFPILAARLALFK